MKENLQPEAIESNGSAASGNGQSGDLPMMSEALKHPAITAIHKDEAVVDYRDTLLELKVPLADVLRNSDALELKLAPLTNGDLRKGLERVYAAKMAAEDYKARVGGNSTREVEEASAIEISE